ncbi:MAG TPA: hypothetical protein VLF62_02815 [Candidatus Saccharimonadales bacterium]|nr:hypothetical protein [Candidatus Saccharimonadales bacterium]
MKFSKITSVVAGLTVLAATLAPVQASALTTATMTLSGATQSNGSFAVTVFENTGSDTVTGAKVEMSFSQAVSNIAYDYSVGPFTAVTPSGAHNAYGTVTGTNPVARVSFTLATPGTVTASINANSYLKHAGDTSVENFAINRGSADFTYSAPVVSGGQGGGSNGGSQTPAPAGTKPATTPASNGTKVATNNTSTPTGNSDVAAAETKAADTNTATAKDDKKSDAKKDDTKNTADKKSNNGWLWILIALAVAAVAYLATRKNLQAHVQDAKAAEAKTTDAEVAAKVVAPAAAATAASAGQKNASNKSKGNKKAHGSRK